MFWTIVWATILYFIYSFLKKSDPLPLLGIYSQPGKWYQLKFRFMKFVIERRKKKSKDEKSAADDLMNSKFGGGGSRRIQDLDCRHDLPQEKKRPVDAVFFDASNKDGWYFTLGTAQRKDDIMNFFFILRVPGKGTYMCPEMLIDTNVKSVDKDKMAWTCENGYEVRCIEPMKQWRLSYKGKVIAATGKQNFTEVGAMEYDGIPEEFDIEFSLNWSNFGDYYDFDTDCSSTSIAHSLSIEPWSRALFKRLQDSHQLHYEQFGFLEGDIQVAGETFPTLRMTSMRDHTISAYRNWADLRRYIMMIYHLDDGTCIHTSVISMPETVFSHLEFGYVILPNKRKIAVDRVHFELPHHGEDRDFPDKFHYSFDAEELHYEVDVHIIHTVSFKMGLDLASQVNENMAKYVANGITGQGFAECVYRIAPY